MRIATAMYHQQAIESIGQRSEMMAKLQQQLSTGKRINQASDDPIGAAESERIRASSAQMAIEQRMMSFASGMLTQAEDSLAASTDTLQSMRDLLIGAGSGALLPQDRSAIATQLAGMRDALLSIANQGDGSGGYVFGGQGTSTVPFAPAGAPVYTPNGGTLQTGLETSFDTTLDGGKIFLGDGSTTTSGSIFNAIDSIVASLNDPTLDSVALRTELTKALAATDTTFDRMLMVRTSVGEQLRALDTRGKLIESGQLRMAGRLADISATDYAQVISDMQTNRLTVDAAMRSYAQISQLSLFDHL